MVTQELLNHIKSRNVETRAWVAEDPKNRMAGLYSEDVAHWEDRGIATLEELERDELVTYIYEGHKDAFGVKGRHYNFDSMSLDQLKAECDYIEDSIKVALADEEARQKANIESLEERIVNNINMGASDRTTAIRWILEAEDLTNEHDVGYIQFTFGVPYTHMTEEFRSVMVSINSQETV